MDWDGTEEIGKACVAEKSEEPGKEAFEQIK